MIILNEYQHVSQSTVISQYFIIIQMKSLTHHGVLFPPEYESKFNFGLSKLAEEMLYAYSKKMNTEYVHNPLFNQNFYKCLRLELKNSAKFPDDFKDILTKMSNYTEDITPEQKESIKAMNMNNKKKYGYAKVNGVREPLANYIIEPPGIFIGRGNSPYIGLWKYRIQPEDVTINFISDSHEPPKPPKGHHWKDVISNPNVTYIAKYTENIGNVVKMNKEVRFGSNSSIINQSDIRKFEKADKLLDNWDNVQKYIISNITNSDIHRKECALIAWLIQYTSIRIGSEETENEVVGASTLKVKNIHLYDSSDITQRAYAVIDHNDVNDLYNSQNKSNYYSTSLRNDYSTSLRNYCSTSLRNYYITLNFIGKDSIEFNNTYQIPKYIWSSLKTLMKHKNPDDFVFNVNSQQVNAFLNECLEGLTAKVFRTAWAKKILLELYNSSEFKQSWPDEYKVLKLKLLIIDVSLKLNHKKTTKVILNDVLKKLNDQLSLQSAKLDRLKDSITPKKRIHDVEWKIKTLQLKIEFAEKSYGINISTSLTNYINPRVIYEICKAKKIKIDKIYNATLLSRFKGMFK
jgi:DNA topoisomerase-1